MRHAFRLALCVSLALLGATPAAAQTGNDLFQQALVKERADGDVRGAIRIYERIVRGFTAQRTLVAQALLQLGQCYEKLGSTEAERAYRRVVREFADQDDLVAQARTRLDALGRAARAVAATADSAGLVVRRVWANARDPYFTGGVSADGRYLSYIEPDNGAVSVRDLARDTSYTVVQTQWAALRTALSPDGRTVAYQVWDTTARLDAIRVTDLLGAHDRLLYRNAASQSALPMAWSRDGGSLLTWLIRHDHVNQIALVRVADGSSAVLKSLDWRPAELRMALSPDGHWIAYSYPPAERSRNRDVYLLAADGSRETPAVQHPADDFVIGWTPDGRRLVIGSDRTGELGVWALPVTDGRASGPLELVHPGVTGTPLGIAANGDYFYGVYDGWADVFVAELDPATGRIVSPPTQAIQRYEGNNSTPEWSPDGTALVVRSGIGRPSPALLIRSLETGDVREINPRMDGLNFHFLSWAPHANAVLAIGRGDNGQYGHVFRIDLATGDAVSIVQPEPQEFISQPEWSPDGRSIFYASRGGPRGRRIVQRVVSTGEETDLHRPPATVYSLRVSPSGSELAFVQNDTIKVLNVGDRAVRTVVAPGRSVRALAWTRDGAHLLYGVVADSAGRRTQLMRVAVASGEVQPLDIAMENLMHLKVHPDGRHVAFTAKIRDERVEVWAIEKLFEPRGMTIEPGRGR